MAKYTIDITEHGLTKTITVNRDFIEVRIAFAQDARVDEKQYRLLFYIWTLRSDKNNTVFEYCFYVDKLVSYNLYETIADTGIQKCNLNDDKKYISVKEKDYPIKFYYSSTNTDDVLAEFNKLEYCISLETIKSLFFKNLAL